MRDSLFYELLEKYPQGNLRERIICSIGCTTPTAATACNADSNLVVGDLAYMLIDEIEELPNKKVLKMEMDAFLGDCKLPYGMFEAFHYRREDFKNKTMKYIRDNRKKE